MKTILWSISIFALLALFYSCDPPNPKFYTEEVRLKADIKNTAEVIKLGDTIQISLYLPDTIVSNTGAHPVHSLQECSFPVGVNLVDTASKVVTPQRGPVYRAIKGKVDNIHSVMNTDSKPYGVVANIKPLQKGIYFLHVGQDWLLHMNNGYRAKLFVNFNVADKHYNLLSQIAPYFGGQEYYNAFLRHDAEGRGSYFFRVE